MISSARRFLDNSTSFRINYDNFLIELRYDFKYYNHVRSIKKREVKNYMFCIFCECGRKYMEKTKLLLQVKVIEHKEIEKIENCIAVWKKILYES